MICRELIYSPHSEAYIQYIANSYILLIHPCIDISLGGIQLFRDSSSYAPPPHFDFLRAHKILPPILIPALIKLRAFPP